MAAGSEKEHHLGISWFDSAWIPMLNPGNILDYFSERSNPFYDRQCNNEMIKMQRLSQDQLNNMTGTEYVLLHIQEPILYIVRKQHRHSPQQATPITDYYIIAGVVYQAPDLCTVLNSRLLNTVHNLQTAFEEAQSYSRYHPSKGYWWDFHQLEETESADTKGKRKKEQPGSMFQRQRVDLLLGELAKKFPPKFVAPSQPETKAEDTIKTEVKTEIKQEKADDTKPVVGPTVGSVKPPPDKKPKLSR